MSVSVNMNVIFTEFVKVLATELDLELETVQTAWANSWAKTLKIDFSSEQVLAASEAKPKKAKKAASSEAKPKAKSNRVKNAYNFFCEEERKKINEQNNELDNEEKLKPKDILKMINSNWKALSEDEKKPYEEMAAAAKSSGNEEQKEDSDNEEKKSAKTVKAKKPSKKDQEEEEVVPVKEAKKKSSKKAEEKKEESDNEEKPKRKSSKKAEEKKEESDDEKKEQKKEGRVLKKKEFDFKNAEPVDFSDKKWWKCVSLELNEEQMKYHKATGLVFSQAGDKFILEGMLKNETFSNCDQLDQTVLEWCVASNVIEAAEEGEEEGEAGEVDVESLFGEDDE
jgi:hypothetical protein